MIVVHDFPAMAAGGPHAPMFLPMELHLHSGNPLVDSHGWSFGALVQSLILERLRQLYKVPSVVDRPFAQRDMQKLTKLPPKTQVAHYTSHVVLGEHVILTVAHMGVFLATTQWGKLKCFGNEPARKRQRMVQFGGILKTFKFSSFRGSRSAF